ncbi:TadE/TadG family type IV pilus assembly protein [Ruicaihuangia caeni]|uniref:TadE/TadG family type IV pilus assembly protein n=1 Tax=Ruicaihuangia caeni TaxID=3042517 RepID=UPI00339013C3
MLRDDRGSAPAEFVMVSVVLVAMALAVMQFALALHVRNTLIDAASEGARFAALADRDLAEGEQRTRDLIAAALGSGYAHEVSSTEVARNGHHLAAITVRATLPLAGLLGVDRGLEVSGHAVFEELR